MATRGARDKQKQNEQHSAILLDMLEKPENKYCADCLSKGPRWASWNLGVFLCIRCSGIHRSMGVHISKVRSVNLDTWAPDWIHSITKWGNARANDYWEYNLPANFVRPSTNNGLMEQFIRDKYERQRYKRKETDPSMPDVPQWKPVANQVEPEANVLTSAVQGEMRQQRRSKPPSPTTASDNNSSIGSPLPAKSGFSAFEGLIGSVPVAVAATSPPAVTAAGPHDMLGSLFQPPSLTSSTASQPNSNGATSGVPQLSLSSAPLIAPPPVRPATDDIMQLFNNNGGVAQPKFGFGAAVPMPTYGMSPMAGTPMGAYPNGATMTTMQQGMANMTVNAKQASTMQGNLWQ